MTTAATETAAPQHRTEMLGMLRAVLARRFGPGYQLRAVEHRPSSCRSTFAIEEIDVVVGAAELHRMMLKTTGPRGVLPNARMAKPLFLHDPQREIELYRHVLAERPHFGAPALYSTVVEPGADRYWLLLERVFGTELHRVANLEGWREAARWLAGLHSELAPLAGEPGAPGVSRLLRYDGDLLRMWIVRALATIRAQDPFVPRELWLGLERLAGRYDHVVERLVALPRTVVHGETYGSNILLSRNAYPTRVCAVDWEMAGIGPHLLDLAALVASERDEARRRAVALAYRAALAPDLRGAADERGLLDDLACCRLHLAIQWLGPSPDHPPPRTDRYGWLAEALRLAEELAI